MSICGDRGRATMCRLMLSCGKIPRPEGTQGTHPREEGEQGRRLPLLWNRRRANMCRLMLSFGKIPRAEGIRGTHPKGGRGVSPSGGVGAPNPRSKPSLRTLSPNHNSDPNFSACKPQERNTVSPESGRFTLPILFKRDAWDDEGSKQIPLSPPCRPPSYVRS
jgi:hypothetical protein